MNGLGIDFKIDSLKSVFTEEKNKFNGYRFKRCAS